MSKCGFSVGNLFNTESGVVRVESVFGPTYKVFCSSFDNEILFEYQMSALSPILMSDEWHEKFGGEKKNGDTYYKFVSNNGRNIEIVFTFYNWVYIKDVDGQWVEVWSPKYKERKMYVHEFQNLYNSLSAEKKI